jgi:V8-like Glu-specific endopeptidase
MNAFRTAIVVALLSWSCCVGVARALTADEFNAMTRSQRMQLPLEMKLRFARPMPDPPIVAQVPAPHGERLLSRDDSGAGMAPASTPVQDRYAPLSSEGSAPVTISVPKPLDAFSASPPPATDAREVGGSDLLGPIASATMPQPLYYTYVFPWSAISKLLLGFNGHYFVCSATLINRYFLLTAGHCVYSHDPNEDGNPADAAWADEVYVLPAQTDLQPPYWTANAPYAGVPEHPFGEANYQQLWAYSGWIDSSNTDYDQAYLMVDRPLGDTTGWLGVETNVPVSSLNFSGYPAEVPYVPPHTLVQYPGFDAGNVTGYTAQRIALNAYTYGGHSGGPVWRYDGASQYRVQGMNSTSDRQGVAYAARVTNQVFQDMFAQINTPRPENLYADLAEWTRWNAPTANLYTPAIHPGESLIFDYTVGNVGYAETGDISTAFYLSTGSCFSGYFIDCYLYQPVYAGIYLASQDLPSLPGNNWYWPQATVPTSATLSPGQYWVAWYMTGTAAEYYSGRSNLCVPRCNNQAGIATPVRVADYSQLADLGVSGIDVQPRYALQGTWIDVSATVTNTGTFPTRPMSVALLLSHSGTCDGGAQWLASTRIASMAESTSTPITLHAYVPVAFPVGTARACITADYDGEVIESDEANNTQSLQVFVDYGEEIFTDGFELP